MNTKLTTNRRTLQDRLIPWIGRNCNPEKNRDWGNIDLHLGQGEWKLADVGPDYITVTDKEGSREFTFSTGLIAFRNLPA